VGGEGNQENFSKEVVPGFVAKLGRAEGLAYVGIGQKWTGLRLLQRIVMARIRLQPLRALSRWVFYLGSKGSGRNGGSAIARATLSVKSRAARRERWWGGISELAAIRPILENSL
jgi:hypothetical protein